MLENREIRAMAREQLKGNWGTPILAGLIYFLIVGGGGAIPFVGFLISLAITGPMTVGMNCYFLRFGRGQQARLEDVLAGFNIFSTALITHLLRSLFVFLWALLLIVPGIVAAYRYSMVYYILVDWPEMGAKEAIDRSKALMDGLKMKLFLLDLSFIGWALLCILTLGIGFLWFVPYASLSRARFYEEFVRGRVEPEAAPEAVFAPPPQAASPAESPSEPPPATGPGIPPTR